MLAYLTLIFGCQLAGELFVAATGLPLPGPVIGMVILFCGLAARGGVPAELAAVGDTILHNLSLLFVPAGVGVMLHGALLGREWLPISVALIASTVVTIAVTGVLMAKLSPAEPAGPDAAGHGTAGPAPPHGEHD